MTDWVDEILKLDGSESTLNVLGVGPSTQQRLHTLGIDTVRQLVDYCKLYGYPSFMKKESCVCVSLLVYVI